MGWFCSGKCTSTNRLDGKVAVITGSNTGIGKITAMDFYKRGASVIIACRNLGKGKEAVEWIKDRTAEETTLGELSVMELDLSKLASVRNFSERFNREYSNLHLLINNAGVMVCPHELTEDGFEMQIATNHLGHFLLTMLLLPTIAKSTPARIVNLSSIAHRTTNSLSLDDFNYEKDYSPVQAYGRSKLANILFTRYLAKRLEGTGINVYAVHPGVINTELTRHMDSAFTKGFRKAYHLFNIFMKTPEQGAQTTIYCAVDDATANQTGLYYDDCRVASPTSAATNDELAQQLWDKSVECVNVDSDEVFNRVLTSAAS